ncbi:MAG: polysaccharide deacetylase family protein [Candidatus Hydrogenedentes bacterium]|nr:polysaccharide deacetylase family protein [Candidatus Hydrogenedentota bacterium]
MPAGHSAKIAIKRAFKSLVRMAGPVLRVPPPCVRILTYHNVGSSSHEMNVTPEAFRAQMEWLHANCPVVTLDDHVLSKNGVAITFDDGYRDNLVNAAPVLHELGLPATVFMIAGRAGTSIRDEADPEVARLMSWDELREIAAMGVTIGSHTMTHPHLSSLDELAQLEEMSTSKRILEETLNRPVPAFAYPFGSSLDFTGATVRLAQRAGYSVAVSNQYGVNTMNSNPWVLRRIWIDRSDSLDTFQAKVTGDLDGLRLLDCPVGIRGRRLLNRLMRIG